jgi:drug/metabolite transporter (DMT)-like permease
LFSGPLLGEWVGWRRWTAIGVGFFRCFLLVVRPGFGGIHPAALLTFCGAIRYALYVITTRVLARTDTSETTLLYSNLVGAVAMLLIIRSFGRRRTAPCRGAYGAHRCARSGGHYLLILGHRLAPASTLAPFIYTQIVWTTTLGFLVFGDLPNHWTIIGGLVVVSSGLYLLNRERKLGKAEPSAPVA